MNITFEGSGYFMKYKEDIFPGRTYCSCSNFLYSIYNRVLKPTPKTRIYIDYNQEKIIIECKICGKKEDIPFSRIKPKRNSCMD